MDFYKNHWNAHGNESELPGPIEVHFSKNRELFFGIKPDDWKKVEKCHKIFLGFNFSKTPQRDPILNEWIPLFLYKVCGKN